MGSSKRERQAGDGAGEDVARSTSIDFPAVERALGAAWLHAGVKSTTGSVAVHDADGRIQYISPSVTAVLGYEPDELLGAIRVHLLHPDDRDGVVEKMVHVLQEPRRLGTLEFRVAHRDGSWRWLETHVVDDAQATMGAITELKRLGVSPSIDDFGTGYSSLGYLKRFPVDDVQVDSSFIDGLGAVPEDSAIVAAVVGHGHALGLTVIAEGVETDRHRTELVTVGCDAAQGYLFARPSSDGDLLTRVQRPRSGVAPPAD